MSSCAQGLKDEILHSHYPVDPVGHAQLGPSATDTQLGPGAMDTQLGPGGTDTQLGPGATDTQLGPGGTDTHITWSLDVHILHNSKIFLSLMSCHPNPTQDIR